MSTTHTLDNFKQKEIGIYSIFIGNYTVFYQNFIKNIISNFLPTFSKKFYIVTDNKSLPKIHDNTDFFYTELIGFPYETLYRFKYFLQFKNITSDIIYFLNSNAFCNTIIIDNILPDSSGYVFTLHNSHGIAEYSIQTFEKNMISTSYIPPSLNPYYYVGGRFYGATKDNYLRMCSYLDNKINDDEKNNYIAMWHDESHINHYFNLVLRQNGKLLDISYHVPEEVNNFSTDKKIIYYDKRRIVKDYTIIKKQLTHGNIIKNKYNSNNYIVIPKTFNVLIATIGRPTLQNMLNSLLPQLTEDDHITVVFDGFTQIPAFDFSIAKCKIHQFYEPIALGFWGHGIRNKYANIIEPTDFVMHADDDDSYSEDTFVELRNKCVDTSALYIAKIRSSCRSKVFPDGDYIKRNHIGTPCGIIPYNLNKSGNWGHGWGGDGMFYEDIASKCNNVVYLDKIIYNVRH